MDALSVINAGILSVSSSQPCLCRLPLATVLARAASNTFTGSRKLVVYHLVL